MVTMSSLRLSMAGSRKRRGLPAFGAPPRGKRGTGWCFRKDVVTQFGWAKLNFNMLTSIKSSVKNSVCETVKPPRENED